MKTITPHKPHRNARGLMLARLFLILLIVFVAEIVSDLLIPRMLSSRSMFAERFSDSLFLIAFTAPFIWWVLIRPFQAMLLIEKAQFEHLYLQMVDAVVILDGMDRIIACNPSAEKLFGYSSSEIEGEGISRIIQPSPDCHFFNESNDLSSGAVVIHCNGLGKEGREIPLSVSASEADFNRRKIKVLIIRDISTSVESENKLRESEDRFRMLFEKSEDAIILISPGSCTIIDANETTEKLYGYSRSELVGRPFIMFRSAEELQDFTYSVCMLAGSESCQQDHIVNLRKDGTEIHLSLRAKVIKLQGEDAIYCTMRDISTRLRMEEEARSIQSQLIHSNKMTSLGLLVAGIAHEINNPNNYIMTNSQMLYKVWEDVDPLLREKAEKEGDYILGGLPYSTLEKSLPEMITAISEGSRRIKNIISGLKNYSRQSGTTMEEMNLNRAVFASLMLLDHHIRKYTENFVLDLDEMLPAIKGSSQQIEQVVINLVMNSLQSLTSRTQRLEIKTGLSEDKKSVLLRISDEGRGISEGVIKNIMEPFFTTRLDAGGTGLGLSIVRSIIESHKGSIEFTSMPGHGTVVDVFFPL